MICLIQNVEDYNNDLRVILMAFYMGVKIITPENIEKKPELGADVAATLVAEFAEGQTKIWMKDGGLDVKSEGASEDKQQDWSAREVCGKPDIVIDQDYHDRKVFRNVLKRAMYRMLSERTGRVLPWGSLTGVRPVKIAMEAVERGCTDEEIQKLYQETYVASREKAEACVKIARREKAIIETIDERNEYCLYIGIPFCPTRCLYCSFTSYPIFSWEKRVSEYLTALEKEIDFVSSFYRDKILDTIYIGGGTPTTLKAPELERLLSYIEAKLDLSHLQEFTVEAGRADSITRDKLEVLRKHGVTRISVNPQTMNQKTLDLIGRRHTVEQVKEAFALAREVGFTNINMDIILGLPEETEADVQYTIDEIVTMQPDSLTVHSLAIKRASKLSQWIEEKGISMLNNTEETMKIAMEGAKQLRMVPYYLYRQKNMSGNFENVGYATEGNFGIYNILIMEEKQTIAALGAGSISKRVYADGRIERCDNVKDVGLYIEKIDEMIERKRRLFAEE